MINVERDKERVLQHYFDDLLSEAPKPAMPSVEDGLPLSLEALQKKKLQALLDREIVQHQQKVETPTDNKQPEPIVDPLQWHDNGRPVWAQDAFDVLLFEVGGLTLAVPLISLGQIRPLDTALTPIFGQSEWFMGLLPTPEGNIKTVNTALFVMPERYSEAFLTSARFVISIEGLPWGLAVDSVNQPSRIHPDEVKWRSNRSGRPWLAGTVKSAMCALIDIPQMGRILLESEK